MSIEASYRKTGNAASVNVCLSLYTSCKVCARNGRSRDIAPLRRVRVRPEMLGHRTRDIGSHTSHNPNNAHVAAGRIDMESPQRFSVGSISMNQSMPPNELKVSLRNPIFCCSQGVRVRWLVLLCRSQGVQEQDFQD